MSAAPPARGLSPRSYFSIVALATLAGWCAFSTAGADFARAAAEQLHLATPIVAAPHSFYSERVAPVFREYCVACHGRARHKGALRLDTLAQAMRSGRHGPAIVPGKAEASEVYRRLLLPTNDPQHMPPEGRSEPGEIELTLLRLWLEDGASGTKTAAAFPDAPRPPPRVVFPALDPRKIAAARAPLAAAMARLQDEYPVVLDYVSRGSPDIRVNGSLQERDFGDDDLAKFAPLAGGITWMDLSGTAVTDASAPLLASMAKLRALRLGGSGITDATARALLGVRSLRALAVDGTRISPEALARLRARGVRVHAGDSPELEGDAAN